MKYLIKEAQVCTLILIGRKMKYLIKEAQVCTLILIGRKMKYLIKGGSGLYPYPDWAENEIPHQRRLKFVPLSWLGGKWNISSKEAQVCTLILIGQKMMGFSKEEPMMEPSDFCTMNSIEVLQKDEIGVPKAWKGV